MRISNQSGMKSCASSITRASKRSAIFFAASRRRRPDSSFQNSAASAVRESAGSFHGRPARPDQIPAKLVEAPGPYAPSLASVGLRETVEAVGERSVEIEKVQADRRSGGIGPRRKSRHRLSNPQR